MSRSPLLLFPILLCAACLAPSPSPPPPSACQTIADCQDATAPICDPNHGACRPCRLSEDDARCKERDPKAPRCGEGGACAACAGSGESLDCRQADGKRPTCEKGSCVACARAADCGSGVCLPDGGCADGGDVIYVDNQGGACDRGKDHNGTLQDPLCEIGPAVERARMQGKAILRVMGSAVPYAPVIVNATAAGGLLIAGAPSMAGPARVRGNEPGLTVQGGAGPVVLVVSGLEIGSRDAEGVLCDRKGAAQAPELTLVRALIADSRRAGVLSVGCALTVDATSVTRSGQGGVMASSGLLRVRNAMIFGNSGGPGVRASDAAMGSGVSFSTIAFNVAIGQPSGVDCGGQMLPVESSIVAGNLTTAASQFRGCALSGVVTGSENIPGGVALQPEFVQPQEPLDVHLTASQKNQACCIDKVQQGPGAPDRDIDGRTRPQGPALDIGAHEVPKG